MDEAIEHQNEETKNEEVEFFDHEPTTTEKAEMRRATKTPSQWLQLLCSRWASENEAVVSKVNDKFLEYKSYLNGQLSSQLLCRLSILGSESDSNLSPDNTNQNKSLDFWAILGIEDEFDRNYIVAQIEKFCSLYNIRGSNAFDDEDSPGLHTASSGAEPDSIVADSSTLQNITSFHSNAASIEPSTAAGPTTVAVSNMDVTTSKKQEVEANKGKRKAKDARKSLESERRLKAKKEQERLSVEKRSQKARVRHEKNMQKASERAAREATREEKRRKKNETRARRELLAQQQKEAALRRAAELVQSNRVPIEITRGAAAASAAANDFVGNPKIELPPKRTRSSIIVSTASDLHQIVTHSKNLWTKYNAIAKEHNRKVNWITVAKELGIHVKVREKYARMHARAVERGFNFETCGHFKIKENAHIFLEPIANLQVKNTSDETKVSETEDQQKHQRTLELERAAQQQAEIEQAAAAAAAAAMKANGVKAEELIDASLVAQIETPTLENSREQSIINPNDETAATMKTNGVKVEEGVIDTPEAAQIETPTFENSREQSIVNPNDETTTTVVGEKVIDQVTSSDTAPAEENAPSKIEISV